MYIGEKEALLGVAVRGMSYADDSDIDSKSAQGLGKMVTVVVSVF